MHQNYLAYILLLLLTAHANCYYCSSQCIDYVGACYDETPNGCWVCNDDTYSLLPINQTCVTASQRSVVYSLLPNDPSMTLGNLSSTNPTPFSFSNYTLSGLYSNIDTLEGNFTDLSSNHYSIQVRFGVGYLYLWNETDQTQIELTDSVHSSTVVYNYSCDTTDDLTGTNHTNWECIRLRGHTMQHNDTFLHVKWSAIYPETNSNIQAWGIKEILITEFLCHPYCATCTGATVTQCLSCSTGFYLQGNTCVQFCQSSSYAIVDLRRCVGVCPSEYYATTDSQGNLQCTNCISGCALCSNSQNCQAWLGQDPNSNSSEGAFKDHLQFWILLLIVIAGLLVVLVYCLVKREITNKEHLAQNLISDDSNKQAERSDSDPNETKSIPMVAVPNSTEIISGNNSLSNTLSMTEPKADLWFNELVEMEPVQVQVRGRRRRKDKKQEGAESKAEEEGTHVHF